MSIPDRRRLLAQAYSLLSVKVIRPRFAMDLEQYKIGVSFRSSLAHTRLWKKSLKKRGAFIAPRVIQRAIIDSLLNNWESLSLKFSGKRTRRRDHASAPNRP